MISPDDRVGEYEKVVATAAYRFRKAAEYDDLYQEGMIAVWLCPPDASPQYVSQAVYNRMKNWVRYIKRLRHNHSVDYEEIVDGLQDRNSREHAEELLYDEGSFRSDIL